MIIPDSNLLLYAYDASSPYHRQASAWWSQCLSGTEPVGLAQLVMFSFVRIGTNSRAFRDPMTVVEAANHVRSWLEQPNVSPVLPGPGHVEDTLKLLESLGTAANLVSDAQLAALSIEIGAILHTTDTDFLRFPGLRWLNPLTGTSSAGVRRKGK